MMKSNRIKTVLAIAVLVLAGFVGNAAAGKQLGTPSTAESSKTVKVFVMAGQSNIAGYAGNALLNYQATVPATKDFFAHLRDGAKWIVRDDVFVKFANRKGPLTIGYGANKNYTGIEYEFGHIMGEYLDEPVLLIKVWGGMLYREFRPPSAKLSKQQIEEELLVQQNRLKADNEKNNTDNTLPADAVIKAYGGSYRDIVSEVTNVFDNCDDLFPELKGRKLEVAGFVWFQGFSDQPAKRAAEYKKNLVYLIRDLRKDLNAPKMAFVIPMIGFNGSKEPEGGCLAVQNAQWAMNEMPEFKGNVKSFRTDVFVDKPAEAFFPKWKENFEEWQKIGSHFACHYYGSALWYTKIGHATGEAMIELLKDEQK